MYRDEWTRLDYGPHTPKRVGGSLRENWRQQRPCSLSKRLLLQLLLKQEAKLPICNDIVALVSTNRYLGLFMYHIHLGIFKSRLGSLPVFAQYYTVLAHERTVCDMPNGPGSTFEKSRFPRNRRSSHPCTLPASRQQIAESGVLASLARLSLLSTPYPRSALCCGTVALLAADLAVACAAPLIVVVSCVPASACQPGRYHYYS
jgi:hypothetical protein